ncbi:MAG: deaminase [Verrucomicrobia bacterium]|nr:deaminase [Verrucomicrobiota bacterium]MBU6445801.1 deaminase [Verrucomicrobiota bacterium]MDE3046904.1 deaminase [Verrucomicrobiota bacterium]
MKILTRQQIEQLLSIPDTLEAVEQGFIAYSQGETVVPPVGSLHFEHPPGDCHIKYGYMKRGKYYVVKIASGFYHNPKHNLPSGNGLMLLFDKKTGAPLCLLQDQGYLTDIRTAAAGCIAAKYLAPKNVSCIGIIGTGAQAFYQLKLLSFATKCRKVLIWGRDRSKAEKLASHPDLSEWDCRIAPNVDQLAAECNLIVTTTSSSHPLLLAHQIRPGTHITAMGADDIGKQELDPQIFAKADKVVVDSRNQCVLLGDSSYAVKGGLIQEGQLIELGHVIQDPKMQRISESEITVADLTGIAIQDLQIAAAVFEAAES